MMIPLTPSKARLIDAANPNGEPVTVIAIAEDAATVIAVDADGFPHVMDAQQVSLDELAPTAP